jgi:transcriptional regulator with XRE-family HTH domain
MAAYVFSFGPLSGDPMTITSEQVRAARKLLGWSLVATAVRTSVGMDLVKRYERGERKLTGETLKRLQSAFVSAGVEFAADNPGRPSPRLRVNPEAAPPIVPAEPYDEGPSKVSEPRWLSGIPALISAAIAICILISMLWPAR